jgi:Pectate lyase superfamily protein/SMP-30/Gluconolactonase/LRE-like region
MRSLLLLLCTILLVATSCSAASVYSVRLDDPGAIYLTSDNFYVSGDGKADDSEAIQKAIDRLQETRGEGIVFVPSGRYRVSRTIYLWPGVRIIGYGSERPVFVLGKDTPGYQNGIAYMFFFAGARPRSEGASASRAMRAGYHPPPTPPGVVPPSTAVPDANPGTFYSAISNVDFEIGPGNAGAVAMRFHAAQHSYLSHIDFRIGSGFAGLHEVANEAEDLHFYGGQFGIMARKPSPAWQFTLVDSTFEGQREAAIRENEAGLTLIHDEFRNVRTAVSIDPHYSDQLWIKNSRFANVSGPAVIISNEASRMTEINFENIVCDKVPIFAKFRESGREFHQASEIYEVSLFSHGLSLASPGGIAKFETRFQPSSLTALPPDDGPAIRKLPSASSWVNVRTLGVKGDGLTDDTAALQRAVDNHSVIYFPSGRYLLRDTLTLRPDSILIGLHPSTTQFDLPEGTPAFQGPGNPKPLLLAPSGDKTIVTGLGIYTGGLNSRAVGLLWRAGKQSLVDDVRFLGGHGTNAADGSRIDPYNNTHTADPDLHRPWDSQYPSLWVDGGGGTFANIWTPDTFSQAGLYISNTSIPGFVYELSSEHHVRAEVKLKNVANWQLYALQTEEESGESGNASSLEIHHSRNITIANYHGYRVTHMEEPFSYAVRISDSADIRFRNVHVDANSSVGLCDASGSCRQAVRSDKVPFENTIVDETLHAEVRDREFAYLDIFDDKPLKASPYSSRLAEQGAQPQRLASGFYNIAGAAVDAAGNLYFVDTHFQRIYRWSPESGNAVVVRDSPLDPVNLIFDKAGDLIVVSSGGKELTAYAFCPDVPENSQTQLTLLKLEPATDRPGTTVALPVDYWFNGDFANTLSSTQPYTYISLEQMFEKNLSARKGLQFVAPDKSLFIPTDPPIVQGEPYFGTKWTPILEAYGLVKATPGKLFYATNEAEQRTYRGTLNSDGSLSGIAPFVEQGGESLAEDANGNVYLAAGQIFVYSPEGKLIDRIDVPERPHDILFGGKDRRTLYLLSAHSLYSIRMRQPGREM